ncbi:MAG: hypothetical protein LAO03_22175 [Acidobacteriia bacterium]|nr:hypothetical protein [Terriglobia bacterium]MBZ5723055.1 hypothetical protein [Terriglobia bacterium]
MLETTEQIQTPAVSEFPAAEIPAQPSEPRTPEPEHLAQDEAVLSAKITKLWRLHTDYKGTIKNQTENLRSLRAELGRKLAEMKQVLARPGRNGQWSGWLKQNRISRATADRLVAKYERSLQSDSNCLTEQITEPSEQEIQNILAKLAPKLRKVLRTPASVYRFIDLLASSFEVHRKETEEGFVVLRPVKQTTVADSVSAGFLVEPLPQ